MNSSFEQIIPFKVENDNIMISARDLHDFLQVNTDMVYWFDVMKDYGFKSNEDYVKTLVKNDVDYMMTIDMAKEVSMIQKNDRGKMARRYFIQVEKEFKKAQVSLENIFNMSQGQWSNSTLDNSSKDNSTLDSSNEINSYNNTNTSPTSSESLITNFRDTAKLIGVRENLLVNWLLLKKYCYRDNKGNIKPYAKFMDFFTVKEYSTKSGYSGIQTFINKRGRENFRNMLIDENVIKNEN